MFSWTIEMEYWGKMGYILVPRTFDFLTFSGGIEIEHWGKMGLSNNFSVDVQQVFFL